jgi:hypothetical protein
VSLQSACSNWLCSCLHSQHGSSLSLKGVRVAHGVTSKCSGSHGAAGACWLTAAAAWPTTAERCNATTYLLRATVSWAGCRLRGTCCFGPTCHAQLLLLRRCRHPQTCNHATAPLQCESQACAVELLVVCVLQDALDHDDHFIKDPVLLLHVCAVCRRELCSAHPRGTWLLQLPRLL